MPNTYECKKGSRILGTVRWPPLKCKLTTKVLEDFISTKLFIIAAAGTTMIAIYLNLIKIFR